MEKINKTTIVILFPPWGKTTQFITLKGNSFTIISLWN